MVCAVCPNCGTDLAKFEPIDRGNLSLRAYEVRWMGKKVQLRRSGRLLVSAVVRADGLPVSKYALEEAVGSESLHSNTMDVQLCHVRNAFKLIDPHFDAIETVRGIGIRWRAERTG